MRATLDAIHALEQRIATLEGSCCGFAVKGVRRQLL
jgi:hypothetical protein